MPLFLKWLKIDSRASFFQLFFSIFKDLIKLQKSYNFTIKLSNYIKLSNHKIQFKLNLYYQIIKVYININKIA